MLRAQADFLEDSQHSVAIEVPLSTPVPFDACANGQQLKRLTVIDVSTKRENVALARDALREVLLDGRIMLRPNVEHARFEGTVTFSKEEFLKEKHMSFRIWVCIRAGGLHEILTT